MLSLDALTQITLWVPEFGVSKAQQPTLALQQHFLDVNAEGWREHPLLFLDNDTIAYWLLGQPFDWTTNDATDGMRLQLQTWISSHNMRLLRRYLHAIRKGPNCARAEALLHILCTEDDVTNQWAKKYLRFVDDHGMMMSLFTKKFAGEQDPEKKVKMIAELRTESPTSHGQSAKDLAELMIEVYATIAMRPEYQDMQDHVAEVRARMQKLLHARLSEAQMRSLPMLPQ